MMKFRHEYSLGKLDYYTARLITLALQCTRIVLGHNRDIIATRIFLNSAAHWKLHFITTWLTLRLVLRLLLDWALFSFLLASSYSEHTLKPEFTTTTNKNTGVVIWCPFRISSNEAAASGSCVAGLRVRSYNNNGWSCSAVESDMP